MRGTGLTVHQFTLLTTLILAGPLTIAALAEHLGIDRTTLSRNVRLGAERGLVEVAPGADARERVVTISVADPRKLRCRLGEWPRALRARRLTSDRKFAAPMNVLAHLRVDTLEGPPMFLDLVGGISLMALVVIIAVLFVHALPVQGRTRTLTGAPWRSGSAFRLPSAPLGRSRVQSPLPGRCSGRLSCFRFWLSALPPRRALVFVRPFSGSRHGCLSLST